MPRTSFVSGLLIAATGVVSLPVVQPLGAQSARSVDAPSAVVQVATTRQTSAAPRVIARYAFDSQSASGVLPYLVTVADSAGTIIARASMRGYDRDLPLTVTILDSDLMLQGLTDNGVLTLVLDRQNEGNGSRVTSGRWTLGKDGGALRAK